jgi:hypothetical protein
VEDSAESIGQRIAKLEIEKRGRELDMLEKQAYDWWRRAGQSCGQMRADLEKTARQADTRIIDLRSDLARKRAMRETLPRQEVKQG